MSHSLVKIWVHAVWGTKYRQDLILPSIEPQVHQLIFDQLKKMDCKTRIINGMPDHVHALFLLSKKFAIEDVMKQAKGAVSFEFNQLNICPHKLQWQIGYGAFSVSEDRVSKVQGYIKKQKQHHQKESFKDEITRFGNIYGMQWVEDD